MSKTPPPGAKLHNQVAQVRKELGVQQSMLAHISNISRSSLSKIEQGHVIPSVLIALKLAQALHTDVSSLFSYSIEKPKTNGEKLDNEIKEILKQTGRWYEEEK